MAVEVQPSERELVMTEEQPGEMTVDRSRARGIVLGGALVVFAAVLRLWAVGTSYDLFEDEIDYVDLSQSLRHGTFPPVFHSNISTAGGGPFLLHPPMDFVVSGLWLAVTRPGGSYFHVVNDVRVLQGLLAAMCAGFLYVIGTRVSGSRWVGAAAALLFALEPYVLRQNGRVLLETNSLTFVLAGVVLLLRLYQGRTRHPALIAIAGGLLGGFGVVGKELALLLVGIPLLAALLWTGGVKRRWTLTALVSSLVPYAGYLVALLVTGSIGGYWTQISSGFRRFFGAQKTTGFSRKGSPSLTHTLIVQLSSFGTTYLLLALGLLAALYLLVTQRRRSDHRLLVMVVIGGGLTVFYALLFGTIEEQFLYFLIVPSILTLVVGVHAFVQGRHRRMAWRVVPAVALAAICVFNLGVWVRIHIRPDNGQQRMAAWFARHASNPGIIGNDTDVTALALHRMGYRTAIMPTPATAAKARIRYLTVLPKETAGNFGELDASEERFYERTGHPVFSFHEATYGEVQIIETNAPSVW